eukprot:gb/GFBE01072114.1/.p1 GENE.gb/GFBE01072114.1/~~gb/GFBE01072114.1/.p1  ORF type:complete len:286 (+),score=28.60 gb/GFBE01072114.1/:1-858(+)
MPKQNRSDFLRHDATSLVLHETQVPYKMDVLLSKLDSVVPGKYDFVLVSPDDPEGAVHMNFVDTESARKAFDFFKVDLMSQASLWSRPLVCQAGVQGLGRNLARYAARVGYRAMQGPDAPQVFANGVRVANLMDAVNQHVTIEIYEEIRQLVAATSDRSASKKGAGRTTKPTRPPGLTQFKGYGGYSDPMWQGAAPERRGFSSPTGVSRDTSTSAQSASKGDFHFSSDTYYGSGASSHGSGDSSHGSGSQSMNDQTQKPGPMPLAAGLVTAQVAYRQDLADVVDV